MGEYMQEIKVFVGCCGFPRSRRIYFTKYKLVELQNTFYSLPSETWIKNLLKDTPSDAIITIKAWQVITHPHNSPTWKKIKEKPLGALENYGYLKPTRENYSAWDKVLDIAIKVRAKVIVLQTPASLPYNDESKKWIKEFLKNIRSITPRDIVIGWEPRGLWSREEAREILGSILEETSVTHVVDLLKIEPVYIEEILYSRLHGLGGKEVNYRYKYTENDLNILANKILELKFNKVYVLFNNIYMFDDGLKFKEIAANKGLTVY